MSFSLHVKFQHSIIETKSMIKPKKTFRRPVLHLQHCLIKFTSPIHTSRLSPSAIKMWRSELHQLLNTLNRKMTVWSEHQTSSSQTQWYYWYSTILFCTLVLKSQSPLSNHIISPSKSTVFFNVIVKFCSSYWTWEYSSNHRLKSVFNLCSNHPRVIE